MWKFFEQKQRDQDKTNKIFFKKGLTTKRNNEVFFEDLAWKTNFQEELFKKRERKTRSFKKWNRRIKDIFEIFQKKTKRQFLKRPKKKIDKRKSRTVISKKKKTQQIRKNMERTRQQHDARRKKQEIYHR